MGPTRKPYLPLNNIKKQSTQAVLPLPRAPVAHFASFQAYGCAAWRRYVEP